MDDQIKKWKDSRNVFKLLQHRENNDELGKAVRQYFQFTNSFIKRLGLEVELEGHQGCVNCLQWSADGRHLASGSDDTHIIYWDPFCHKKVQVIPTTHLGNIFSVKFLGSDNIVATGAGDSRVIVQSVEDAVAKNPPLLDCHCHAGRVKRLATCPEQPMVFWSAAEDGLVLQYDMREPHDCSSTDSKVFVDMSYTSELKCIAVNPTKPHLIAVGANDCFVRLYDRRKVKITKINSNQSLNSRTRTPPVEPVNSDCVQYFAPGHLAKENARVQSFKLAATYVAFNSAGTEMLVNMGCEQIYLFNVDQPKHFNRLKVPPVIQGTINGFCKPCSHSESNFPSNSNNVKSLNNVAITKDSCACDYMKRANKWMERKWLGDMYAACRDYLYIVEHWPRHHGGYLGLIRCLLALKWKRETDVWLAEYLRLFPERRTQIQPLLAESAALDAASTAISPGPDSDSHYKLVSEHEEKLRTAAIDYHLRFIGHCNTTTDIKEANFLGEDGNYICAGSDDGAIYIWERKNCEIVTAMWGDFSIVNCVQPHPSACMIASSGIDPAVKIWTPSKEDGSINTRMASDLLPMVENNQVRLEMDPFETMLANMGYRLRDGPLEGVSLHEVPTCRTS